MHKRTLILSLVLPIFSLFLFTSKALAGGGPVAIYAFPLRPFDQTKTFIIEAETYTSEPCDLIKPVFSFKDNLDGDSIATFTPPDDGTYFTSHFYIGAPEYTWKERCITYVQAKSGTPRQRTITVSVVVNGKTEVRETAVSFGDDYISKQLQTYGRINDYDNSPHLDVVSETYISPTKREVQLQWQKIAWAANYAVFGTKAENVSNNTPTSYTLLTKSQPTKIAVALDPFSQYYLIAFACKADDPCDTVKEHANGPIFLDKMRNVGQNNTPTYAKSEPTKTIAQEPQDASSYFTPAPTIGADKNTEDNVQELNKKVAQLEGKLAESQKRQNALEQAFNNLVSWLKTHIPFFK